MKTTLNLIVSVILVFIVITGIFSFSQIQLERRRLTDELEHKADTLSRNLLPPIQSALSHGDREEIKELVEWGRDEEQVLGILVYNNKGLVCYVTGERAPRSKKWISKIHEIISQNQINPAFQKLNNQLIYFYESPIVQGNKIKGNLVLLQNAEHFDKLEKEILHHNFNYFLILLIPTVILTLLIVRWHITGPIIQIAEKLKRVRLGENSQLLNLTSLTRSDILGPLASEVNYVAKNLIIARSPLKEQVQNMRVKQKIKIEIPMNRYKTNKIAAFV